ncbi:MAG: chorismate-binding protein [Planctomycetes bacterium]|nr:chorismate-binding protein [Planctomycetota bacterium]
MGLVDAARAGGASVCVVPVGLRVLADVITPILAYRRLVDTDERTAPSFLLESVEGGDRQGRYSILGSRPAVEVAIRDGRARVVDHRAGTDRDEACPDLIALVRGLTAGWRVVVPAEAHERGLLPRCVVGGWFGYAAYDTVRAAEPGKLDPAHAPPDDRGLPELSLGLYDRVAVFDHVDRVVHLVRSVRVGDGDDPGAAYDAAAEDLRGFVAEILAREKTLGSGVIERVDEVRNTPMPSNTTREEHATMVERAKEYIRAGDIFQVVVGQRFERRSDADPFAVYRALRAVNPSPYMVYMQTGGAILVASSPEILCRVRRETAGGEGGEGGLVLTNRPLAGTRRRGRTAEEDKALEAELLADPKEIAEHAMLVDLGRNDVGRVARPGTVTMADVMSVERYSHVMHISSTVTGVLRDGLDCWDALRATLPVGTISGAPKIRAMQIIDELEKVRRGPYGGGLGWVSLDGEMDMALALRTIVVPVDRHDPSDPDGAWLYHIQAAGGIVADSVPELEFKETVNKAAALGRAIDLAERAF